MTIIREGELEITFSDGWRVIKYDDCAAYRNGIQRLEGSQAVDIVAIDPNGCGHLIEIKNFRGQNRRRLLSGELFHDTGKKVRDSVAGLIGAARMAGEADPHQAACVRAFVECLTRPDVPIKVMAWVETDGNEPRWKAQAAIYTRQLKIHVRWLTKHALVAHAADGLLAGVQSRIRTSESR